MSDAVDYKEFIEVYMEAYRTDRPHMWVARQLGLSGPDVVVGRRDMLRKKGVQLPTLTRHNNYIDADELNDMVNNLKGEKK